MLGIAPIRHQKDRPGIRCAMRPRSPRPHEARRPICLNDALPPSMQEVGRGAGPVGGRDCPRRPLCNTQGVERDAGQTAQSRQRAPRLTVQLTGNRLHNRRRACRGSGRGLPSGCRSYCHAPFLQPINLGVNMTLVDGSFRSRCCQHHPAPSSADPWSGPGPDAINPLKGPLRERAASSASPAR